MKVKINTCNGPLPYYLTKEKWYKINEVFTRDDNNHIMSFSCLNDDGEEIFASIVNSAHLGGGSWEIME